MPDRCCQFSISWRQVKQIENSTGTLFSKRTRAASDKYSFVFKPEHPCSFGNRSLLLIKLSHSSKISNTNHTTEILAWLAWNRWHVIFALRPAGIGCVPDLISQIEMGEIAVASYFS